MPAQISAEELAIRQRLKDDLRHYGEKCLKIRPKLGGALVPLTFNRAQEYLHARLEEQKATTGKVRALILKGRQQGISTYVGGRFYHQVTHSRGTRCFILTHEDKATQNLFEMVDRFHENCPALVKPNTSTSNAKELAFSKLDSGYAVGTAGTKAVGRSQTIQLLHGSEVGFWPNAADHFAGVIQAVPDLPGTEIILESTANGMGGEFHRRWQQAERGESDYIAIFIPWFWQEEYQRIPPPGFAPTEEELQYMSLHKLALGRIAWRRAKVAELGDPILAKQEFPATSVEAFQTIGHDSYIPSDLVLAARKRHVMPSGPLVIGYDPAWKGGDRTAAESANMHKIDRHSMAFRRGRRLIRVESRRGLDTMQAAGWLKQVIDLERPARVFIDVGGVGAGVYDRLKEMGYATPTKSGGKGDIVRAINFGSSPLEPNPVDKQGRPKGGYVNRRAEMWGKSKEWLEDPAGVDIPDSDTIHADACAPGYTYDSLSRVLLEKKEDIRKRGLPSPDEWDAVCFVADTLIATPVGPRKIVDIRTGDEVLTPFGVSRVMVKWVSKTSAITTAEFSNGAKLSGKGAHKIFVRGRGVRQLDALALTDEVEILSQWRRALWRLSKLSFIGASGSGFKQLVDITSPVGRTCPSGFFIAGCGLTIMGLFHRAALFTTRITTGATTRFPILSACRLVSIPVCICESGWKTLPTSLDSAKRYARLTSPPSRGTERLKGPSGTGSMDARLGKGASASAPYASSAAMLSERSSQSELGSAPPPARKRSPSSAISRTLAAALTAARNLLRIGIGRQRVVPVNVATESVPPTLVYNLTLAEDNAYYANGVLAFNCLTFAEPVLPPREVGQQSSRFAGDPVAGY